MEGYDRKTVLHSALFSKLHKTVVLLRTVKMWIPGDQGPTANYSAIEEEDLYELE